MNIIWQIAEALSVIVVVMLYIGDLQRTGRIKIIPYFDSIGVLFLSSSWACIIAGLIYQLILWVI